MPSINTMPITNMYPALGIAQTLGMRVNPSSPDAAATGNGGDSAPAPPPLADPITTMGWLGGGLVFAILLVGLMLAASHFGGEESKFGNVKASIYNVFIISLSAFVGLPILRVAAIKSDIHGLTQWALSV